MVFVVCFFFFFLFIHFWNCMTTEGLMDTWCTSPRLLLSCPAPPGTQCLCPFPSGGRNGIVTVFSVANSNQSLLHIYIQYICTHRHILGYLVTLEFLQWLSIYIKKTWFFLGSLAPTAWGGHCSLAVGAAAFRSEYTAVNQDGINFAISIRY